MTNSETDVFIDNLGVVHAAPEILEILRGRSFLMLERGDSFILKLIPEELEPPHRHDASSPEDRSDAEAAFFQRLAEAQAKGLYLDFK